MVKNGTVQQGNVLNRYENLQDRAVHDTLTEPGFYGKFIELKCVEEEQ